MTIAATIAIPSPAASLFHTATGAALGADPTPNPRRVAELEAASSSDGGNCLSQRIAAMMAAREKSEQ
jgi:hypothetical protein